MLLGFLDPMIHNLPCGPKVKVPETASNSEIKMQDPLFVSLTTVPLSTAFPASSQGMNSGAPAIIAQHREPIKVLNGWNRSGFSGESCRTLSRSPYPPHSKSRVTGWNNKPSDAPNHKEPFQHYMDETRLVSLVTPVWSSPGIPIHRIPSLESWN